jgi:hypothetical protein
MVPWAWVQYVFAAERTVTIVKLYACGVYVHALVQMCVTSLTTTSYWCSSGLAYLTPVQTEFPVTSSMQCRPAITIFPILRSLNLSYKLKMQSKSYPCNRLWRPIGLWDVEAPTFSPDIRLTDGSKVVSLTHRPPLTPQEDSWYSFLLEAESTPGS